MATRHLTHAEKLVVGFEEKVYFAEEGQALTLPVVVKEGNLTQRVVLKVNVEDSSTTGGYQNLVSNIARLCLSSLV